MPGSQTVAIPWDDGSGDNLYMDFTRLDETNDTVFLSADYNNTGSSRTKIIKFQADPDGDQSPSGVSQAPAVLRVVQQPDNLIVATFEGYYSVYDENKAGFIMQ